MNISDFNFSTEYCSRWLAYLFAEEVRQRKRVYLIRQEQQEAIFKVADWMATSKAHFGLVLNGITGNGKTTLVRAMQDFFNKCKFKNPLQEESVFYMHASITFLTSKELYHLYATESKRFRRCMNTFILAIDDFGTEESEFSQYGNRYKPLEELLSYRYERMLPTIITTNLSGKAIREKYGDRLADRFKEMMEIVTLPDINFRDLDIE